MSEIKKLIERLCPDGVEYKKLSELGTFYGGLTGKSKKDFGNGNAKFITYMNVFSNPALDLSVTDTVQISEGEKQNKVQYKDILFTGSSETPEESGMTSVVTQEVQEDYYLNSFCFGLRLYNPELFNADFLKHYFRSHEARKAIARTASGVTRFNVSKAKLANFEIPVPPIEVQSKIVEVLDNFTELESELESELEARRKQYEYYRNQLLTFDKVGGARFDVKWMKLGEIGEMIKGSGIQKSDFVEYGYPCIHYGQLHTFFGTFADKNKSFIKKDLYDRCKKAVYGDLIIASTSEDVEACCKATAWLGGEVAISGDAHIFHHNQNPKYIAYFFQTDDFAKQKRKYASGVKVVRVSSDNLAKIVIPIPSMEEQERIVSILDRFEALTTDLQSGLPAEIEARRKQYEYYREKLLSFKRKEF